MSSHSNINSIHISIHLNLCSKSNIHGWIALLTMVDILQLQKWNSAYLWYFLVEIWIWINASDPIDRICTFLKMSHKSQTMSMFWEINTIPLGWIISRVQSQITISIKSLNCQTEIMNELVVKWRRKGKRVMSSSLNNKLIFN